MDNIITFISQNSIAVGVVSIACVMAFYSGTIVLSVIFLLSVVAYVSISNKNVGNENDDNNTTKKKGTLTVEKKITKQLPTTPTKPSTPVSSASSTPSTPSTPPPPVPPRSAFSKSAPNSPNVVVGGQLSSSSLVDETSSSSLPSSPFKKNNIVDNITSSPKKPSTPPPPIPTTKLSSDSPTSTPEKKKVGMSTLRGIIGGVVGKKNADKEPTISSEEKEKNDIKRKHIADEILQTEKMYVSKLRAITEIFYIPLKTAATANPHPPLTLDQVHVIFSEILTIYNYNSHFLTSLEEKMKSPNPLIGDTFISITEYLKTYIVYINNYSKAISTLEKARKNQNFNLLLQKFSQDNAACDGLDLTSLLIMPVQRIPRYILLLNELVKHTDKKSSEYTSLTNALEKMKSLASDMNENRRQAELLNSMYELQNRLDGFKGDFIIPARKLLLEDDFQEKVFSTTSAAPTATSNRHYILCTDILLRTKEKGKKLIIKEVLNVNSIQFKDLLGETLCIMNESNEILVLKSMSPDDSSNVEKKWKDTIINQQKTLRENDNQRRISIGKTN